jgi:hypothetical protein
VIGIAQYDKFLGIRSVHRSKSKQHVTTQTLQQWGMTASFQFTSPGFPFRASPGWVQYFKKEQRIGQTRMTKYISIKDDMTFEETVKLQNCFKNRQLQ